MSGNTVQVFPVNVMAPQLHPAKDLKETRSTHSNTLQLLKFFPGGLYMKRTFHLSIPRHQNHPFDLPSPFCHLSSFSSDSAQSRQSCQRHCRVSLQLRLFSSAGYILNWNRNFKFCPNCKTLQTFKDFSANANLPQDMCFFLKSGCPCLNTFQSFEWIKLKRPLGGVTPSDYFFFFFFFFYTTTHRFYSFSMLC